MHFISYAQNGEDVLLNRVFANMADGFYVDIGAYDPVNGSVTKAFSDRGWTGINVEPGEVFHRLAAARPRDINLQMAVLDRSGVVRFVQHPVDAGLSHVVLGPEPLVVEGAAHEVPCDTLAAILAEHAPERTIDFLKIDVEGAEAAIIRSTNWCAIRPTVLVIEATYPWSNQLANADWEPVLLAHGYKHVWFDGINCFYLPTEREDLLRHFVLPINVIDDWTPFDAGRALLEAQRVSVDAELQGVRAELAATEAQLSAVQARESELALAMSRSAAELAVERENGRRLATRAAMLDKLAHELSWPDGPAALRTVLPLARLVRRIARTSVPAASPHLVSAGPTSRSSPETQLKAAPRAKAATKRLARGLYRLARPVLRPIAWRTRAFMTSDMQAELARMEAKLDRPSVSSLPVENTLRTAMDSEHEPGRIAFITCLPPQDTGIATYSFYSWLGFEGSIDVFCPVTDSDWFFSMKRLLSNRGAGPRLLDVEGFMSMDNAMRYEEIVIAVGNSDHHVYIFNVIKKLASFGSLSRVTFYIHDPCLLNLVRRGADLSASQLRDAMSRIYHQNLPELLDDGHAFHVLVDAGIYGIRYFFNAGIGRYLVNSRAAQKLVEHDLRDTTAKIDRIFLPVFLAKGFPIHDAPQLPEDRLVVGVFGVPSHDKGLEKITSAVRFLNENGRPSSLILAGFLTRQFTERQPHFFRDIDMEVFDGPADAQMVHCMQQCHVSVQLRRRNLGESSGIVPQLLALGKDVIVSAVGAFVEYGDAVRIVDPDISAMELAAEILRLRDNPIAAGIKRKYVDEHSPAKFQASFMQLFSKENAARIGSRSDDKRLTLRS